MQDEPPAAGNEADWNRRAVLGLIVGPWLAMDLFLSPVTSPSLWSPGDMGMLCVGAFVAQFGLLATWAALSGERLTTRLPRALALALLAGFAGVWASRPSLTQDRIIGLLLFGGGLLVFLGSTGLLAILRRWRGWRIVPEEATHAARPTPEKQFSLRQLAAWITGAAVALALARCVFPTELIAGALSIGHMLEPLFAGGAATLVCLAVLVPWLGFALGSHYRTYFAILGAVLLTAFSAVAIAIMGEINAVTLGLVLWLQAGLHLPMLATLIILRLCGFRLVRQRRTGGRDTCLTAA